VVTGSPTVTWNNNVVGVAAVYSFPLAGDVTVAATASGPGVNVQKSRSVTVLPVGTAPC
jgi:hypothetical protein